MASAALAGRTLRIKPANTPMAVAVYSQTGQVLASVRPGGLREQAIVGSTGILFPMLRAEDGTIYLRVQPASDWLALAAVDLPTQMQEEHDRDFFRFARGMICVVAAVVAAVLGWRSRDRAQFVFAALFAWSALEEWKALSALLTPGIAVPRWLAVTWLPVLNALWMLAADQALRLAERAPRWHRVVLGAAALFALLALLRLYSNAVSEEDRLGWALLLLAWFPAVFGAAWWVWRLGHRVGLVIGALWVFSLIVYGPGLLSDVLKPWVTLDVSAYNKLMSGYWPRVLGWNSLPLFFMGSMGWRGLQYVRSAQQARTARAAAEAANEAKSAFLATMSHEIRTPMNARDRHERPAARHAARPTSSASYAATIRDSGDALLTIINDILDFSKIEAGRMDIEAHPFDLRECVESALDLRAPRARPRRTSTLAYVFDGDVPAAVIAATSTRLRQILLNLLSNAVKFTENGEVDADASQRGAGDELNVRGARHRHRPAPKRHRAGCSSRFSQADSTTTRKYGGTGLGPRDQQAARGTDGRHDDGRERRRRSRAARSASPSAHRPPRCDDEASHPEDRRRSRDGRAPPAAHPAGRGQRGEPEARDAPAAADGLPRRPGRQRHRGRRVGRAPDLRRGADGRADARDGRPRGVTPHLTALATGSARASSR